MPVYPALPGGGNEGAGRPRGGPQDSVATPAPTPETPRRHREDGQRTGAHEIPPMRTGPRLTTAAGLAWAFGSAITAAARAQDGPHALAGEPITASYVVSGDAVGELLRRAESEWGFRSSSRLVPGIAAGRGAEREDEACRRTGESAGPSGVRHGVPGVVMWVDGSGAAGLQELEARFFEGRALNTGWRIKGVTFVPGQNWQRGGPGSAFTITKNPTEDDPSVVVRLRFEPNSQGVASEGGASPAGEAACLGVELQLASLIVIGPAGGDWRDAFRR